jgi:hypothetical protein
LILSYLIILFYFERKFLHIFIAGTGKHGQLAAVRAASEHSQVGEVVAGGESRPGCV